MAKRTDLAAPSVIDPAAFTFVAGCYFGGEPGEDMDEILGEWMAERDEDGSKGWYSKRAKVREVFPALVADGNFARKGTCDHCGAHFDWGAVFKHTSGGHIVVGNICVANTLEVPDRAQLDKRRMQSRLAAAREAARMAAKARAEAATLGFEWLYSETHADRTLADIARKGLTWGGITARQLDLVKRIRFGVKPQWQLDKEAREAARAAQEAAAEDVPATEDRIDVEGEIVSTKQKEGYMGETVTKCLVVTTRGFKLWGTLPRAISDAGAVKGDYEIRGKRVRFSCKVERSKDDPKFGYFSRPTKAKVIEVPV